MNRLELEEPRVDTVHQAHIPRPEHPMPHVQRSEWLNLNGLWEFGEANEDQSDFFLGAAPYPDMILVPYCRESRLSGLERKDMVRNVWYRRGFIVPQDWKSPRMRLHIGACDWKTRVWVNGELVGEHLGGNCSFCFDITHELHDGENTLVIHAFDDTSSGLQALGKQSLTGKSEGIFYTPTTGIWQTVWLEGVGDTYISDFRFDPDLHAGSVHVSASIDGTADGLRLVVSSHSEMGEVEQVLEGLRWRENRLSLELPAARMWSPEDPFLYPITLELRRADEIVDRISTYAGLREISIDGAAVLINGKAVFQRLILDQGFFPDGLWTAPNDEALRGDIELAMAAGFNGARMHQKVFEPRYHYWADKLGYLCWAEFPSYGADYDNPAVHNPIIREWNEIVQRDRNHPSIIGWCPFNETPPSAYTVQNTVVHITRQLDPGRPCLETSGWTHVMADAEILDAHDYDQNPVTFRERLRKRFTSTHGVALPDRYGVRTLQGKPFFISEYGGIGWCLDESAWGYGKTPRSLEEFYERFAGLALALMENRSVFGLCYTQLTDVEQEQNGLYCYDRSPKFDMAPIREVLAREAAYEHNPPLRELPRQHLDWSVLVGSAHDPKALRPWQYIEAATPAECIAWVEEHAAEDGATWYDIQNATAKNSNLGGRQTFEFDGGDFEHAVLVVRHDDDTELWLNGESFWTGTQRHDNYEAFNVTDRVRPLLKPGSNDIRFHVAKHEGPRCFDMALLIGRERKRGA